MASGRRREFDKPRRFLCGLARQQAELMIRVIRLAVALAKSQDHRASCGVFAFGQHNAVRQWLCLRYPDTRQTRTGNVGLVLERGGEIVWDSAIAMAWLRKAYIEAQSELLFLNTVRLCFASTFTKKHLWEKHDE